MPKNRIFKITDGAETKEVEAMSFKKAVKSYQGNSKSKMITIEWMTKGGELFVKDQKLPLGRKKKIGRQSKVRVSHNPLVKLLVKARMAWADLRGHHGKVWDYEPGEYYMGMKKGTKDHEKRHKIK